MIGKFEIFGTEIKKYEGDDEEIIIPESITTLGDYAFSNATNLKRIILHDHIDEIGSYCFYNCDHLVDIHLPDSIRFIGGGAFSSCRSLEVLELPKYIRNINPSLFYKSEKLHTIKLNSIIKNIDHDAFSYCKSLKHIELPDSLVSIGNSAFEECEGLKKVILPDGVEKLGKKVFFHCLNLQQLVLSSSLKEVDEGAFQSHSTLTLFSKNNLLLTSKMFDCNWNFDWGYSFKMKNGENYNLYHSFIPHANLKMYKPSARIIMIVNYLETLDQKHIDEDYLPYLDEHRKEVYDFIVANERYDALNHGIDHQLIKIDELTDYLDDIKDREEKAKLLDYQKDTKHSSFAELDDLLDDLFD